MGQEWTKEQLRQIWRFRQRGSRARLLKDGLSRFMRGTVIPRQKRLAQLTQAWMELLPEELAEHSCLEEIQGGCMRVLVDGAAYQAELDLMLREGLLDQLRAACPRVSLSQVKLMRGQWYRTDEEGNRIPEYKNIQKEEQRRSRYSIGRNKQDNE